MSFCFFCRATSNIDTGAGPNNATDYPGSSQPTFPLPPTKRPYHRLVDTTSSSRAQKMKTKHHGSVSSALDHNANGLAVHGSVVSSASRSSAKPESVPSSREKSDRQLGSEENIQKSTTVKQIDTNYSNMPVLWSGQVAVNGSEICSAELVSRCQIRHKL